MRYFVTPKQTGVALIQVLLITSMLLILVVQLSKDAREQVQTSLRLKEKAELLININSEVERVKYELLTTSPNQLGVSPSGLNFYSEPVQRKDLAVTLQDQAGLLSLASSFDLLPRYLNLPQGNSAERGVVNTLMSWQGLIANGNVPAGFRGGYMHYSQEVNVIPGWQSVDSNDSNLTYYPTGFYNPALSSESILYQLFSEEDVQSLLSSRQSGVLSPNISVNSNLFSGENTILLHSDFVQLRVTGQLNGREFAREELVSIELGSVSLLTSLSL
jgi:general secretion pathway protein K